MAKERDRGVQMHREVETGRRVHRPGDGGEEGRRGNEERGCVCVCVCSRRNATTKNMKEKWKMRSRKSR